MHIVCNKIQVFGTDKGNVSFAVADLNSELSRLYE